MAKSDVLERVAADLARGHTEPAIRRLSSLVAAHPADLDLRRRLAAVHRRVGNRVQAGRWSYLSPGGDPAEAAAFERTYPSARWRLRRLHWLGRDGQPATEFARTRLAELAATPVTGTSTPTRVPGRHRVLVWVLTGPARTVAAAVAGVAVLGAAVLGAVTVIQWLTA